MILQINKQKECLNSQLNLMTATRDSLRKEVSILEKANRRLHAQYRDDDA